MWCLLFCEKKRFRPGACDRHLHDAARAQRSSSRSWLKLYCDPTNLTRNGERVACPVSASCLALPLEVLREHASSLLVTFFSKLPDSVLQELISCSQYLP